MVGIGIGCGVAFGKGPSGPQFMSSRDIARLFTNPTGDPVTCCILGSSRKSPYGYETNLATYATEIVQSGVALQGGNASSTTGHTVTTVAKNTGNLTTVSPRLGGTQNWFPTACFEDISIGVELNTGIWSNRLYASGMNPATVPQYPLILPRMQLGTVRLRGAYRRHPSGILCAGEPGPLLTIAENINSLTSPSASSSRVTDSTGAGYGYRDVTYAAGSAVWDNGTIGAWSAGSPNVQCWPVDQVFAHDYPIMRVNAPGIVWWNWSSGGAGVERWANDQIIGDEVYTSLLPLHAERAVFLVEVWALTLTYAQTLAAMQAIAARVRLYDPLAPIVWETGYPTATSGASPVEIDYIKTAAVAIGGGLVLDTYNANPDYATGVAAGLYDADGVGPPWTTDGTHHGPLGVAADAALLGDLFAIAAA